MLAELRKLGFKTFEPFIDESYVEEIDPYKRMEKIEIEVTKLYKILIQRGMTQKDLHNLIKETNNGESVSMYILNEIINGKRTNFNINTLKPIKKALNVSYDDLIDD